MGGKVGQLELLQKHREADLRRLEMSLPKGRLGFFIPSTFATLSVNSAGNLIAGDETLRGVYPGLVEGLWVTNLLCCHDV